MMRDGVQAAIMPRKNACNVVIVDALP